MRFNGCLNLYAIYKILYMLCISSSIFSVLHTRWKFVQFINLVFYFDFPTTSYSFALGHVCINCDKRLAHTLIHKQIENVNNEKMKNERKIAKLNMSIE